MTLATPNRRRTSANTARHSGWSTAQVAIGAASAKRVTAPSAVRVALPLLKRPASVAVPADAVRRVPPRQFRRDPRRDELRERLRADHHPHRVHDFLGRVVLRNHATPGGGRGIRSRIRTRNRIRYICARLQTFAFIRLRLQTDACGRFRRGGELRLLRAGRAEFVEQDVRLGIDLVESNQTGLLALGDPAGDVGLADGIDLQGVQPAPKNRSPAVEPAEVIHHTHQAAVEHLRVGGQRTHRGGIEDAFPQQSDRHHSPPNTVARSFRDTSARRLAISLSIASMRASCS